MKVIDTEYYSWFLLQKENRYFLDLLCSHSAAAFEIKIELNNLEIAEFKVGGRAFILELAKKIQQNAFSTYKDRNLNSEILNEINEAIKLYNVGKTKS